MLGKSASDNMEEWLSLKISSKKPEKDIKNMGIKKQKTYDRYEGWKIKY